MSKTLLVFGLMAFSLGLISSGCRVSRPFRGPGYEPEEKRLRSDLPETLLVAITAGTIQPGGSKTFSEDLAQVEARLEKSPGLVGYSLRRELFGNKRLSINKC